MLNETTLKMIASELWSSRADALEQAEKLGSSLHASHEAKYCYSRANHLELLHTMVESELELDGEQNATANPR